MFTGEDLVILADRAAGGWMADTTQQNGRSPDRIYRLCRASGFNRMYPAIQLHGQFTHTSGQDSLLVLNYSGYSAVDGAPQPAHPRLFTLHLCPPDSRPP